MNVYIVNVYKYIVERINSNTNSHKHQRYRTQLKQVEIPG